MHQGQGFTDHHQLIPNRPARAASMTPERRKEIAQKAIAARWERVRLETQKISEDTKTGNNPSDAMIDAII